MGVQYRPVGLPGPEYSSEEESQFRRNLESYLIDVASAVNDSESAINGVASSASKRESLIPLSSSPGYPFNSSAIGESPVALIDSNSIHYTGNPILKIPDTVSNLDYIYGGSEGAKLTLVKVGSTNTVTVRESGTGNGSINLVGTTVELSASLESLTLISTGGVWVELANSVARTDPGNIFNVKDYGATGDGVTNDTVAIQTALTAATAAPPSVVLFPPGTYVVSTQLSVGSGTTLQGYGATLFKAAGSTGHVIRVATGAVDAKVMGLTINGNKAANTSGHGIAFVGTLLSSQRLLVADCTIINTYQSGIQINSCKEAKVVSNFIYDSARTGIEILNSCEDVSITGNHVKRSGSANVAIAGLHILVSNNVLEDAGENPAAPADNVTGYGETNKYFVINNNVCKNGGNHGIHLGGNDHVISNNHVYNPTNDGVFLGNEGGVLDLITGFTISGNRTVDCRRGVNLVNCDKGTVSGNSISSSSEFGVYLDSCSDMAVTGNVIFGSTLKGIRLTDSVDSVFSDNVIKGNLQSGIESSGTCSNNVFSGNNIRGNTLTGIVLGAGESNNYVNGNSIFGNTPPLNVSSATTDATDNFTDATSSTSVAAAAVVTLPSTSDSLVVTDSSGPTTINEIVNSRPGRIISLLFNTAGTVVQDGTTSGNNIRLSSTFTVASGDTLVLMSHGVFGWYELSRSVN
jgi:parallel beta-helix repeat protein